jgi:hypothetical protein
MRANRVLMAIVFAAACLAMTAIASADGVAVGGSSLIGTLDYSDTFTTAANGGNVARVDGQYPFTSVAAAAQVEDSHGNATRSWTYSADGQTLFGSINTDATVSGGTYGYPGSSNAGSATGFTQWGGGPYTDFGIAYGLRSKFVVQADAVSLSDRVEINIGTANDSVAPTGGLSVIFYATGHGPTDSLGQFGLYASNGAGLAMSGLSSGLPETRSWHNIGAKFDLDAKTIDVYTDQVLRGHIDLNTYAGGAFLNTFTSASNAYVSIGGGGDDRIWFDNFQVGSAVPEPTTTTLMLTGLFGLVAYAWRKRR